MVNALINWSLTAVTMNFEGIIAIINLNQWFITAIMWSFLLMVSRAACTIALKMFLWWLISQRGGLPSAAHSSGGHQGRWSTHWDLLIAQALFSGDQVWNEEQRILFQLPWSFLIIVPVRRRAWGLLDIYVQRETLD